MKHIAIFSFFVLVCSPAFAAITLTDEQFANVDIIHAELKKKDAGFIGLSGSKEEMTILGNLSDKEARKVIDKIDFSKARVEKESADPKKSARKSGRQKIQSVVSLTDDEFKALFGGE